LISAPAPHRLKVYFHLAGQAVIAGGWLYWLKWSDSPTNLLPTLIVAVAIGAALDELRWPARFTRVWLCHALPSCHLHLKQFEWWWNHRRDNLYALLLKDTRSHPLN